MCCELVIGGQRLDAMKGCKALAKRAHACDYEKQHNNPSRLYAREYQVRWLWQQRSDGVEAGIRHRAARGGGGDAMRARCDRASGEVEPRAAAPVGEREEGAGGGGAHGI